MSQATPQSAAEAEIAAEARFRGVQQGVVIEEAWALYKARNDA